MPAWALCPGSLLRSSIEEGGGCNHEIRHTIAHTISLCERVVCLPPERAKRRRALLVESAQAILGLVRLDAGQEEGTAQAFCESLAIAGIGGARPGRIHSGMAGRSGPEHRPGHRPRPQGAPVRLSLEPIAERVRRGCPEWLPASPEWQPAFNHGVGGPALGPDPTDPFHRKALQAPIPARTCSAVE